jgi:RimJ/RimL family protein N-acetyltransferase
MEIRKMSINDIEFFNKVRNESVNFLHDNTKYSLEDNIKWFEKNKPRFFIVEVDNKPIGYFRTSNWVDHTLYIGMDIHPKYRGLGYAMPAYEIFIEKLKNKYDIKKIYLEVLTSNKRAINIYNKLNFTIIDLLPHNVNDKSIKMELIL